MGRDGGERWWQAFRGVERRLARGMGLAAQRCVRLIPMVVYTTTSSNGPCPCAAHTILSRQ
jgi:hypothetical protein